MAAKRELIDTGTDKRYVRRDRQGRFNESDDVGRSLAADRRRKAKTVAEPGQGDKGDRTHPKEIARKNWYRRQASVVVRRKPRSIQGARSAPFPGYIEPCLATLLDGSDRAVERGAGGLLEESRSARPFPSRQPPTETRTPHPPHDLLSQGEAPARAGVGASTEDRVKAAKAQGSG